MIELAALIMVFIAGTLMPVFFPEKYEKYYDWVVKIVKRSHDCDHK